MSTEEAEEGEEEGGGAPEDVSGVLMHVLSLMIPHLCLQVELPGPLTTLISLWDVGGQNASSKMLQKYIYGAHAVLLECE